MEPKREYFTTCILFWRRANNAIISSVALPHVAFRSPPTAKPNLNILIKYPSMNMNQINKIDHQGFKNIPVAPVQYAICLSFVREKKKRKEITNIYQKILTYKLIILNVASIYIQIEFITYSVRKLTRSASGASPSKLKAKIQGYVAQKISINHKI